MMECMDFNLAVSNTDDCFGLKKNKVGKSDAIKMAGMKPFDLVFQVVPKKAEQPILFIASKVLERRQCLSGLLLNNIRSTCSDEAFPGCISLCSVAIAVQIDRHIMCCCPVEQLLFPEKQIVEREGGAVSQGLSGLVGLFDHFHAARPFYSCSFFNRNFPDQGFHFQQFISGFTLADGDVQVTRITVFFL